MGLREPLPGDLVLVFALGQLPPQAAGKGLHHGGPCVPTQLPAGQDRPSVLSPDGADRLPGGTVLPAGHTLVLLNFQS